MGDLIELSEGICYDLQTAQATCNKTLEDGGPGCIRQLDPSMSCFDLFRLPQFSTCKNDCPGVRSFGIIGGGALLFAAPFVAGTAILPVVGIGAAAAGGGTLATCSPPFCRARSRQCCLLQLGRRGRVVCPR